MARSLNVKHEEAPATSSLFNLFLLLAVAWLALGALVGGAASADAGAPAPAATR